MGWCREPSDWLHALPAFGANRSRPTSTCSPTAKQHVRGLPLRGSPGARRRRRSNAARDLLREARTNGAIFLALPAERAGAQLDQRHESLLRALCQSASAPSCRGPSAASGGVPHRPRDVAARRRAAADRAGAARHAAAARLRRAAPARSGADQPAVPAARPRHGARAGARRAGPRGVSPSGRRSCSARSWRSCSSRSCSARSWRCWRCSRASRSARLVDAVAADVGVLVGSVRAPPPRTAAGRRHARAHAGARAPDVRRARGRCLRGAAQGDRRRARSQGAPRTQARDPRARGHNAASGAPAKVGGRQTSSGGGGRAWRT